ncbi:hypothetical protein PAPYR_13182 [Paratrimastix pyriformis]|uniref:Uncharacterized protein n=1 Tax=Paratrimastix pyriformis TaxID=342808 RepID=A0ABQ8U0P8_9EUKA|nr:hypothetical protein PAPYR_13182 [Paratrimastix pyriformis]
MQCAVTFPRLFDSAGDFGHRPIAAKQDGSPKPQVGRERVAIDTAMYRLAGRLQIENGGTTNELNQLRKLWQHRLIAPADRRMLKLMR